MKSQSGIKKFFEKIGTLVLLAVLLFACTTSPEAPQNPVVKPTKTKTSPAPSSPKNNDPPTKTFSLQNANKIAPDDILEEVAFGGRGGPGDCDKEDPNYPAVDEGQSNPNAEWLAPISVVVCGWSSDSNVNVTLNLPDGNYYTDTVKVEEKTIVVQETKTASMSYVHYDYFPDTNSPTGVYKFVFSGNSGNVEYSVHVSMPNDAKMHYINNIQSYYLYNFLPNEEIRLFLYDASSANAIFLAWERYVVDANGRLIIKANEGAYFVIGESTGPISTVLINPSVILNKSLSDGNQSSFKSCPGALPSRLEIGKYAYVATDPPLDNRVREGAGTDYSIIGYIETGNAMKILDGPKCANGWSWWKVQSIKKSDLVGWTSEGDDTYWLIPCNSLNSCP